MKTKTKGALREDIIRLQRQVDAYNDLLMCVEDKYQNETRHETAKRIIVENQNQQNEPATCE